MRAYKPISRYPGLYALQKGLNCEFFVQHGCGLSTTPTLLTRADATVHAQAHCWKGSSSHKTALQRSINVATVATKCAGYIIIICALQSSS